MDYEKKYKEAIERAKEICATLSDKAMSEYIFPELKESEDDRIRKCIGDVIREYDWSHIFGVTKDDCLAWLEKQAEQKPTDNIKLSAFKDKLLELFQRFGWYCKDKTQTDEDIIEYIDAHIQELIDTTQKSADNVEPKFKIGEWITNGDYTWKIVEVKPLDYILQSQDGNIVDDTISYVDEQFHSFTIEDAKDGDVLMANAPFIFNGNLEGGKGCPGAHCGINTLGKFQIPTDKKHWTGHTTTPATKEQRDQLEKAMDDAEYTFDFEKKELKKIEQKPTDNNMKEALRTEYEKGRADAISEMEKPTWSVEDMSKVQRICKYLDEAKKYYADITEVRECTNWLKSLKDRVQPQPKQEWSEEDECYMSECIGAIATKDGWSFEEKRKTKHWLKSLKERCTWKPSDVQIKALHDLKLTGNISYAGQGQVLIELYNDLKKLAED